MINNIQVSSVKFGHNFYE